MTIYTAKTANYQLGIVDRRLIVAVAVSTQPQSGKLINLRLVIPVIGVQYFNYSLTDFYLPSLKLNFIFDIPKKLEIDGN